MRAGHEMNFLTGRSRAMLLALDQRHADGQIILDPWQPHYFAANEPVRIPGEISRSLWTLCSRKLQAGVEWSKR